MKNAIIVIYGQKLNPDIIRLHNFSDIRKRFNFQKINTLAIMPCPR